MLCLWILLVSSIWCILYPCVCVYVLIDIWTNCALIFSGKYNSWDRVDPVELFTCPTEKKEATPKLRMRQFLSQESKGCDYLVLWLDCDKEGENICFEVIDAVSRSIRNVNSWDVTFRAKFSAITDKDIKYAMANLIRPNENEARSVDARQEIDLRIGCAFTRYQTKFFQGHYGDLDSSLISYGPCQTPTLGKMIRKMKKISYFFYLFVVLCRLLRATEWWNWKFPARNILVCSAIDW